MCGIAGFTHFFHNNYNQQQLLTMGNAIAHRGPDAHGEYLNDNIGLSHRRLSILDLSEAGNQPMYADNNQLVIVFNGEIYNFLELRAELEAKGYSFNTHTDTEVILKLYQDQGQDFIHRINGMFALAIWDNKQQSLLLARDRIGKKPLYYYPNNGDIAFASELKALLTLEDVPRNIRPDAVYDYFAYQYVPDPKTIFEGIYKLEPGHILTIDKTGLKTSRYWQPSFANTANKTQQQAEEELLALVDDCTQKRMISDVPLGAFLSGGIDSSAVVALMAKHSEQPIKTCSIGFDDKKYNETEFAQIVAEQYHTEHFELTVKGNMTDKLEEIARYFDEPFADPSLVPTYFVSKLAREKVTVALAGDGGDEIFAGYEKYAIDQTENQLRSAIPKPLRKHLLPPIAKLCRRLPGTLFKKASSLLHSLSLSPAMAFYVSNSQIDDPTWQQLIKPETANTLGNYHPSEKTLGLYDQADGPDHLSKILYTDLHSYLPGGILVKVDRMSMANSLEVRAPLLDYQVIDYANRLASNLKLKGKEKKHILKKTFEKFLPKSILYRKKMGFSVPLASWLRNELKAQCEEHLLNNNQGLTQFFKADAIKQLWQEHQSQRKDHSAVLWSMLMYQLWWNTYIKPK